MAGIASLVAASPELPTTWASCTPLLVPNLSMGSVGEDRQGSTGHFSGAKLTPATCFHVMFSLGKSSRRLQRYQFLVLTLNRKCKPIHLPTGKGWIKP